MDYDKLLKQQLPDLDKATYAKVRVLLMQAEGYGRSDISDKLVKAVNELYGETAIDDVITKTKDL